MLKANPQENEMLVNFLNFRVFALGALARLWRGHVAVWSWVMKSKVDVSRREGDGISDNSQL